MKFSPGGEAVAERLVRDEELQLRPAYSHSFEVSGYSQCKKHTNHYRIC